MPSHQSSVSSLPKETLLPVSSPLPIPPANPVCLPSTIHATSSSNVVSSQSFTSTSLVVTSYKTSTSSSALTAPISYPPPTASENVCPQTCPAPSTTLTTSISTAATQTNNTSTPAAQANTHCTPTTQTTTASTPTAQTTNTSASRAQTTIISGVETQATVISTPTTQTTDVSTPDEQTTDTLNLATQTTHKSTLATETTTTVPTPQSCSSSSQPHSSNSSLSPPMVMEETPPSSVEIGDPKWRAELKEGLQKLKELTPWSDIKSAELVKGIGALYWGHENNQQDIANTFCELGGSELFINMLLELTKKGLFSSNTNWQIAFYIYNTLWNFSDASLGLALRLGEKGMVRLCTTNISHKPYRDNMDQKNIAFLIKASLNILHNLAKAPGNRHLYREEHVAEKMEPFLEDDPYLKAIGMMTLAYIVEEGQEEILAEKGTNTIEYLVEILKKAQGAKDKRCQGLSDTEVAAGLARLAVHDNNKKKIIEAGGLPLLVSMLHSECLEAQEAAVKAVWNLAFSDDVVNELQSNPDCLKSLEDLSCSQSAEIAKAANGALWVINKEAEKKEREETGRFDSETKCFHGKKPHIMISYQWDSQKEVLAIWNALRVAGYEVWIDVDCMYGSTLQAMAEAVENACAMLMCMSERYKESPNCRTEAEYAFTRRKHIIPIMMEEHYQPDGWLGIILGAKFYMDFSGRLNKQDEMQKLLKEVDIHCAMAKKPSDRSDSLDAPEKSFGSITFSLEDASKSAAPSCLEWSADQVQDWLAENELDILRESMVDYNGRLLYRLHKLRKEAPEFFYTSIKEELGLLKLIDILRFTEALDSLIQD